MSRSTQGMIPARPLAFNLGLEFAPPSTPDGPTCTRPPKEVRTIPKTRMSAPATASAAAVAPCKTPQRSSRRPLRRRVRSVRDAHRPPVKPNRPERAPVTLGEPVISRDRLCFERMYGGPVLRDERPRPRRRLRLRRLHATQQAGVRRHIHEQAARRPDRVRLGHTIRLPGRPVRRVPALALRRLPDQRPRFGRRARRPYRRPQLRADAAAGVDGGGLTYARDGHALAARARAPRASARPARAARRAAGPSRPRRSPPAAQRLTTCTCG
jgi:hypothetical protein